MSVGDNFSLFENLQIINENAIDIAEALGLSHRVSGLPSGGDGDGDELVCPTRCPVIIFLHCHHVPDFRATVNISLHPEIVSL